MMTAIKLAQDLAAAWELARPERRKQLIAALFEAGGKDWRSRPGLNPSVFVAGIAVEGTEDLIGLIAASSGAPKRS